MKRTLLVLFVAVTLSWSGAVLAGSHVYKLYVDGLACPFCAYGVENNLLAVAGVEKLDIELNGGFIRVVMKTGNRLDEEAAKLAVDDSGFTLRAFEVLK